MRLPDYTCTAERPFIDHEVALSLRSFRLRMRIERPGTSLAGEVLGIFGALGDPDPFSLYVTRDGSVMLNIRGAGEERIDQLSPGGFANLTVEGSAVHTLRFGLAPNRRGGYPDGWGPPIGCRYTDLELEIVEEEEKPRWHPLTEKQYAKQLERLARTVRAFDRQDYGRALALTRLVLDTMTDAKETDMPKLKKLALELLLPRVLDLVRPVVTEILDRTLTWSEDLQEQLKLILERLQELPETSPDVDNVIGKLMGALNKFDELQDFLANLPARYFGEEWAWDDQTRQIVRQEPGGAPLA